MVYGTVCSQWGWVKSVDKCPLAMLIFRVTLQKKNDGKMIIKMI